MNIVVWIVVAIFTFDGDQYVERSRASFATKEACEKILPVVAEEYKGRGITDAKAECVSIEEPSV